MKIKLNIIGSGGHSRSLISSFNDQFEFRGIYDESYNKNKTEKIINIKLKGKILEIPKDIKTVLAIGNNNNRFNYYQNDKFNILKQSIIHKSCIICSSSKIGNSNQIYPRVFINGDVKIGENNIINSASIIEHETEIGSNCHIGIGVVISGRVKINDFVFIGANATIIEGVEIVNNVIIGAGSVVLKDILSPGTYVGNPVRRIK
jgi:sugar O-acyltransferase (sialic acid O-acetyltransferase NeuD family)